MCLEIVIERTVPNVPLWPPLMSITTSALLFFLMLVYWEKMDRLKSSLIFLANAGVVYFALFITNPHFAASGGHWVPFQANKLGCFITAMLAPTLWVGTLTLALDVVVVITQLYLIPEPVRSNLPIGEPFPMIAFAVTGFLILWNRMYRIEVEQKLITKQMEAQSLHEIAQLCLRLRDRINTPLQTIEFSIELLKSQAPDSQKTVVRLKNALDRLKSINELLAYNEKKLTWNSIDLSFDQEPRHQSDPHAAPST
jgi:hypothetical protein